MSEDELLRKLGQIAREEAGSGPARLDERWDRLAAGILSAEEEAELRRLAAASTEAGETYEAFRPLGAEFQARVVQAVAAQAAAGTEPQLGPASEVATAPAAGSGGTGGRLLPFRGSVRRFTAWGGALGAAAAAIVAMLVRVAPLPVYTVAELSGGYRTTRGELIEEPRFAPGDQCRVVLRPLTGVSRPSSLRTEAFLLRGDDLRPLASQSEVDKGSGAVRVFGTLDRDLPAGTWTLWMVVGRRGSLPGPAEVRTFTGAASVQRRNWVALSKTLHIQPRAPD